MGGRGERGSGVGRGREGMRPSQDDPFNINEVRARNAQRNVLRSAYLAR
jgi:hypothetical protein